MRNPLDLIEFEWDEFTGSSHFVYENNYTGEIRERTAYQPLAKPVVTEQTKLDYFTNLVFWINTQPPEDRRGY